MRPIVPLVVTLLATASPARAGEWTQFLDENGVRGFSREVPGTSIMEFRSTVVVNAKIEVVGAVLRDVEGLKRPGSSCVEARYVDVVDRDHYSFLAAYEIPGPFYDRIVVLQVENRYDLDLGRAVSNLSAIAKPKVPIRDNAVLITDMQAQFVLEYISREKTGVIYTSRTDPAGNIPAYFANRAARTSLMDNALVLRRAAKKDEYINKAKLSPDAALAEKILGDPEAMARIFRNRLAEFIPDAALVARLAGEPRVIEAFTQGNIAELLLHGWGSADSKREAVHLLLRQLLAVPPRDPAAVEHFVSSPALLDKIVSGKGGDADVAAFIARSPDPR